MYIMGLFEFKEYLQASHYLEEAVREFQLFTCRGYADIHPTRTAYDPGQGKMYKESLNVADYAIWLVESKQILLNDQEFWQRRLDALESALKTLTPEEQSIFQLFQSGAVLSRIKTEPVLIKIKTYLESLIGSNPKLQQKSLDDETDFEEGTEADHGQPA